MCEFLSNNDSKAITHEVRNDKNGVISNIIEYKPINSSMYKNANKKYTLHNAL